MWTHKLKLMLLLKKVYNNITSDTLIVKFGWCELICISFLGGSKVIIKSTEQGKFAYLISGGDTNTWCF